LNEGETQSAALFAGVITLLALVAAGVAALQPQLFAPVSNVPIPTASSSIIPGGRTVQIQSA
jgi:hypothetical protein